MNISHLIVMLASLMVSTATYAQGKPKAPMMSPLECGWPTYKTDATELERKVADMDSSMNCVNKTAGKWLSELDELDKFPEGKDIINAFISRLKVIQDSFQYLKQNCSLELNSSHPFCISFNESILNSEWIKTVYFHSVLMMNDVDFLKSWVSNMPIFDVNKMIHTKRLTSVKYRFTLAEKVAAAPYMRGAMLRALGDLGLLNGESEESYPLSAASSNGRLESVQYLVELGFDPNRVDAKPLSKYLDARQLTLADSFEGFTPLIRSIGANSREVFDYLLSLPNIDVNLGGNKEGNSPLMMAAHHIVYGGDDYFYKKLLADKRVDINHQNLGGGTILTWLAEFSARPASVKMIIDDPRFDPSRHFNQQRASLASIIKSKDLVKLQAYEPMFSLLSASSKVYSYKNEENLTVFEYTDRMIDGEVARSSSLALLIKREKNESRRRRLIEEQSKIPANLSELNKIKKYLLSKLPK